jgi:hypothetical protein
LKSKDEHPSVLTNFVKNILHHVKIECWKFNNAGKNKSTQTMFEENGFGIKCEYTARETPQQNRMVEQAYIILFGRVRASMTNAAFEKVKREMLWAQCAATATKLNNLLVQTSEKKNSYELFYGKVNPIEKHLKIFGEIGIVTKHNTSKINSKLSDRAVTCMFLGYAKDHAPNVYQMLKLNTNAVIITRDIVWLRKLY